MDVGGRSRRDQGAAQRQIEAAGMPDPTAAPVIGDGTDGPADEAVLVADARPDPADAPGGSSHPDAGPARAPRTGRNAVVDLDRGVAVIAETAKSLPGAPGVYRMLDGRGDVLYVGKARHLKRRVLQYTQIQRLPNRLRRMVAETRSMEITGTATEVEALLLESNYIKRSAPRYNVLLRDDKSFPHVVIRKGHPFPQLGKHRGAQDPQHAYFGPFASAGAVNRTIVALQKAFLMRPCTDAVFSARTRPCLQYQIKRCSAPCVGRIGPTEYAALVDQTVAFLEGKSRDVQADLATHMAEASDRLDFETAARYRDRIRALSFVQQHQDINVEDIDDADVFAVHQAGGQTAIEAYFFRGGRNYGSRAYHPTHDRSLAVDEVLAAFLAQFYADRAPPPLVLLSDAPAEADLLTEALGLRAGRKVEVAVPKIGSKRKLVDHALANAREAHARRISDSATQAQLLEGVARVFDLPAPPERIEVYDNSHTQGASAYGAMIVAGPEGFVKAAYRKFAIKDAGAAGDDFASMREVIRRRFQRALKDDPERAEDHWPDLLLIDGGQGQVGVVRDVLESLDLAEIPVVGIAKGPERDAGRERFHVAGRAPFQLEPRDPVLYFLQRLRDEAHRFVIGAHRGKRAAGMGASALDEIPGIGPRRRRALLHHFGSARAIARAGVEDLLKVEGINAAMAKKIHDHFRDGR